MSNPQAPHMTPRQRRTLIASAAPGAPGWPDIRPLPVLISMLNTLAPEHRPEGLLRMGQATLHSFDRLSHDEMLGVLSRLEKVHYSRQELSEAVSQTYADLGKTTMLTHGLIRIAYCGGVPGPEAQELLAFIASQMPRSCF